MKFTTLLRYLPLFTLSLILLSGCKKEKEADTYSAFPEDAYECTTDIDDRKTKLQSVDGEMPYYSVEIDNDNWSRVTKGTLTLKGDGTWTSTLFNERKVEGVYEEKEIKRSGQWRCVEALEIMLVNDQNQEAGMLSYVIDAAALQSGKTVYNVYLESSTNTYRYSVEL